MNALYITMIIKLVATYYLSDLTNELKKFPLCISDHIKSVIASRIEYIEEEHIDSDNEEKEFMKLKESDFRIIVWKIDGFKYCDICHFKDCAEVGFIMKYNNDVLTEICAIDEAVLMPYDESTHMKNWCKELEKERIKLLKY